MSFSRFNTAKTALLASLFLSPSAIAYPGSPSLPSAIQERGWNWGWGSGFGNGNKHHYQCKNKNCGPPINKPGKCPDPAPGAFFIEQYQLYPENADFDFGRCLLYMGSLFNSTVAVHNPYTHTTDILTFETITQNPEYHLGGVAASPYSGLLSIVVDAGAAFNTGGKDLRGTNLLLQYDPDSEKVIYNVNLTETTKGVYGGFQDVEFDGRGNVFVVGTFPASILKVPEGGKEVIEWYKSDDASGTSGFGGLATKGDILLTNYDTPGTIVRFDMRDPKGKPETVPITPAIKLNGTDAIYLPPKYDGKVLLVAIGQKGLQVLRSRDGEWRDAEYLGLVPNNSTEAAGTWTTAAVQMGENRVYMIVEYFTDAPVEGMLAGNRTRFPVVDVTEEVERLVKGK